MENLKDLIGTELKVNEGRFREEIKKFETLIPFAETVVQEIDSLKLLPKLTPSRWRELVKTKGKSEKEDYRKRAKEEMKNQISIVNEKQVNDLIADNLADYGAAITNMYLHADGRVPELKYKDGKFSFDRDNIREKYTVRIETEEQAKIYSKGTEVEKAVNELAELLRNNVHDLGRLHKQIDSLFDKKDRTYKFNYNVCLNRDVRR